MADTPHDRFSPLADSLIRNRNPFPEGTQEHQNWTEMHEIWTDVNLWEKEHRALLFSELLESVPPEEASDTEFMNHVLKAVVGMFDASAGAISRHGVLTDDAAEAFEKLLDEIERVMMAQAVKYRASFIPERRFASEVRIRLNQRKQYWTGQMLRKVREHKEASRANAVDGGIRAPAAAPFEAGRAPAPKTDEAMPARPAAQPDGVVPTGAEGDGPSPAEPAAGGSGENPELHRGEAVRNDNAAKAAQRAIAEAFAGVDLSTLTLNLPAHKAAAEAVAGLLSGLAGTDGATECRPEKPISALAAPAKSDNQRRKRGPLTDYTTAARVAEVVARMAPAGDWRSKVDDICEALDKAQVPFPRRWWKRDRTCNGWAAYDERANAVKAIDYRLEIAKQRKKTTPETLS